MGQTIWLLLSATKSKIAVWGLEGALVDGSLTKREQNGSESRAGKSASDSQRRRTPVEIAQNLRRAQELVRKHIKAKRSLSAELIAERRAEAKAEAQENQDAVVTKLFTFVLQYADYTSITQVRARDVSHALRLWCVRLPGWKAEGLPPYRSLIALDLANHNPVSIDTVKNVWCVSACVRNKLVLVNIVETQL